MTITDIIHALDQEVDRLLQARHLLAETLPNLPAPVPQSIKPAGITQFTSTVFEAEQRRLSPALTRAAEEIKKIRGKRKISPAGRRAIAAGQKRRWKEFYARQRAQKTQKQKKAQAA